MERANVYPRDMHGVGMPKYTAFVVEMSAAARRGDHVEMLACLHKFNRTWNLRMVSASDAAAFVDDMEDALEAACVAFERTLDAWRQSEKR